MTERHKTTKRTYRAPRRAAAAARTREAILRAAKRHFEERAWTGATMQGIAADAGVSLKTVEALFGTKAALLRAVVDYAIRGDARAVPVVRRSSVAAMEAASSVGEMLDLHARHLRTINARSAEIAWVVEQAARSDASVAELWARMSDNRHYAVKWATQTFLAKPDAPDGLTPAEVSDTFWLAIDWGTYRTLTNERGLTDAAFESWLRRYYRRMLSVY